MKPQEIIKYLQWVLETNPKVPDSQKIVPFIIGGVGMGKTDCIHEATRRVYGNDPIVEFLAVSDPTDGKGYIFPAEDNSHARFIPAGNVWKVLQSKDPCTWFWDEFPQANQSIQVAYAPWMLARQLGEHKLPSHVSIILAGNRMSDKAAVNPVPTHVKGRSVLINYEFSADDFQDWMLAHDVHPFFVSFFRLKKGMFDKVESTKEMKNTPNPRNYVFAATDYANGAPRETLMESLAGRVGEGLAIEIKAHLEMAEQLPDPAEIILNPTKCKVPTELSAIWTIASSLAYHTEASSLESVLIYMDRIVDKQGNKQNEYQVMLMQDLIKKKPHISKTNEFMKWATKPENMKLFSI